MENNVVTIYLKANLNVILRNQQVSLKDIVTIICGDKAVMDHLNQTEFLHIKENKSAKYVISILKIMEEIQKQYPSALIMNLGETNIVLEYVRPGKKKIILEWIKTILVAITVFFGSAFSIMTFNEDVSVKEVLELFRRLVMGEGKEGSEIIQISYSIGLPLGIMLFFNHFSKVKINTDPTPLQVQLRQYETDENETIIENAEREGTILDYGKKGRQL